MTKKLLNIKLILRIIISLFVIVNMARSCARAVTYDDVKEYVNDTADYFPDNTYYQRIKWMVNGNSNVVNYCNNAGNGHSNFSIYVNSANYVYFKFWTATTKLEGSSTGIWYTGNYKDFQLQNLNETTSISSTNRSQTNASIDGGYSFSSNLNYENNLRGMTYLTQDLTTGSFPNTFVRYARLKH